MLLFVLVLALQSMFVPTTAFAVSEYDNVIKPGGNALVSNHWSASGGVCGALQPLVANGATSWSSLVLDSSKYFGSAAYSSDKANAIDAFDDAVNSGKGWALVQNIAPSNYASVGGADMKAGDTYLTVYFSDNQTLEFKPASGLKLLVMNGNWYALGISYAVSGSDCKVGVTQILHGTGYSYNVPVQQDGNTNEKAMFINFDIAYPEDYDGLTVSTVMPPPTYVAMGDSFSSGEGNPPFETGTDVGGVNECHRSPQAYPHILQADSSLGLGLMDFVACSGAKTSNVINGQWNELAQVDALSLATEVVTITIGGNDVGFKDFASACATSLCNFSTSAYADIHGKITNDLPGKLADVYAEIDNATSSGAKIYVIGYPQIAPAEMPTGFGSGCWPLNGQQDDSDPTKNDGATAYAVVTQLNETIQDAVTNHGSSKFEFIDPNVPGSPFEGHDWCQEDRYFDIVTLNNIVYSFHPNYKGQPAYAQVVKALM